MTAQTPVRIRLARTDVGEPEVAAIREVLESGILTNGPRTAQFEEEFAERHDVGHAVAICNGTVALAGMLLALGIGPGDEVVVPSMTFISTATSVLHVGAVPVFADGDRRTFDLDAADVQGGSPRAPGRWSRCTTAASRPTWTHCGGLRCGRRPVARGRGSGLGARYQGRSAGSLGA